MSILSDQLKTLRTMKGLTQAEVAENVHLNKQAISQYELGKREPSYEILERICDFFNVTPDYLLGKTKWTIHLVNQDSLTTFNQPEAGKIPVLGNIVAGSPSEAIANTEEYILFSTNDPEQYGALRITGDSMTPALQDGDLVIFRKQEDADSGDLVIAIIDGIETTVKKLVKEKNKVTLQPFNPSYDPLTFDGKKAAKRLQILGKVVESRRRY